jgi:hypothetical protein
MAFHERRSSLVFTTAYLKYYPIALLLYPIPLISLSFSVAMETSKHKNGIEDSGKYVSGQANEVLSGLPHALSNNQFTSKVHTNTEGGLTSGEAAVRLEKFGLNELD